jgi:hypothetical protein
MPILSCNVLEYIFLLPLLYACWGGWVLMLGLAQQTSRVTPPSFKHAESGPALWVPGFHPSSSASRPDGVNGGLEEQEGNQSHLHW